MLTETEVVAHLLRRRLLTASSVVDDGVRVINLSQRNTNFHVVAPRARCFFVKGAHRGKGLGSLAHEASVYELLRAPWMPRELTQYLPVHWEYDARRRILALETSAGAQDLLAYSLQHRHSGRRHARALGQALGLLHLSTTRLSSPQRGRPRIASSRPGIFDLSTPRLATVERASRAGLDLIRTLQRHRALSIAIGEVAAQWRSDTLIHGDVKLANIVVHDGAPGRTRRLELVDWEFGGRGDARWDIGSVFSSYLVLWVSSIPVVHHARADRLAELARYPLDAVHANVRSFWQSYVHTQAPVPFQQDRCLAGAVRMAAVRLVQTAYEKAQALGETSAEIILLLQIALNMLDRPEQAAQHLLGIAP